MVHGFVWRMKAGAQKFPLKWAWPISRDPYNFWQYGRLS